MDSPQSHVALRRFHCSRSSQRSRVHAHRRVCEPPSAACRGERSAPVQTQRHPWKQLDHVQPVRGVNSSTPQTPLHGIPDSSPNPRSANTPSPDLPIEIDRLLLATYSPEKPHVDYALAARAKAVRPRRKEERSEQTPKAAGLRRDFSSLAASTRAAFCEGNHLPTSLFPDVNHGSIRTRAIHLRPARFVPM